MMANVLNSLRLLANPPAGRAPPNEADFLQFLNNNVSGEYVVLYASVGHLFVHGVLVPSAVATECNIDDLMHWNGNPFDSWSIGPGNRISPPLSTFGSRGIARGEQVVFLRSFSGLSQDQPYVEISQRLLHVLGLHYIRERKAWCRLDRHGDIEEVIKVLENPGEHMGSREVAIIVKRGCLAVYARNTNSSLLFMFDFIPTLATPVDFLGAENNLTEFPVQTADNCIFYRCRSEAGNLIWIGGIQVSYVPFNDFEDVGRRKQYESFLAFDWKNGKVREISCSPDSLSNCFTESSLPFGLSPAFFRPEVLSKYKADREKYKLEDRSINCREVWHLQTYDINAAHQVHTYLVYLGQLPIEEQLHWKQFNEQPKAPISERAFKTDFLGDFSYSENNPLGRLRQFLQGLQVPWWKLKAEDEIQWAHYPVTGSNEEWRRELQMLDRLVVEGFEERWLREHARELGLLPDNGDRSITLLQKCLMAYGIEDGDGRAVVHPFRELRTHRNSFSHPGAERARHLKEQAFQHHGGYRQHYTHLAAGCWRSMTRIDQIFGNIAKR